MDRSDQPRSDDGKLRRLANQRHRILYVLHHPLGTIGGVESHVGEMVQHLSRDYACYVLARRFDDHLVLEERVGRHRRRYVLGSRPEAAIIESILRGFGIDLVHVEHLMNAPNDLVPTAKRLGLPVIVQLQDYYAMCPIFTLMNPRGEYCELPSGEDEHRVCLEAQGNADCTSLDEWRAMHGRTLARCDLAVFLCNDQLERFRQIFELPQTMVLGLGIQKDGTVPEAGADMDHDRFRVCFPGYPQPSKGSALIEALVPHLAGADVEVHFLGSVPDDWPEAWAEQFGDRLCFHGRYAAGEAVARMRQICPHLICIFSPWPETFSRVLSESWAAGVPVLVGPLGAPAKRVRESGGGVVLAQLETGEVVDAITRLRQSWLDGQAARESAGDEHRHQPDDPSPGHDTCDYRQLVRIVSQIHVPDDGEIAAAHRELYARFLEGRSPTAVDEAMIDALHGHGQALERALDLKQELAQAKYELEGELDDLNRRFGEAHATLARAYADLDRCRFALDEVRSSLSWRWTRPLRAILSFFGGR